MKYFPFKSGPYSPQLGLAPLDLKDWIEIGPDRGFQLKEKFRLLKEEADTVLQYLPVAEVACFELREVLAQHLSQQFPELYELNNGTLKVDGREYSYPESGDEVMRQISCWTQEDWAVLSARPVRLMAGAVCFPSRWSLKEKIGKSPMDIHIPVPRFDSISKQTNAFLENFVAGKPMWRLNWTIHDSDQLFCPGPHPPRTDLIKENVLENAFLRIERQTLRRLPDSGASAFSIRTYMHRLDEVVADPSRRQIVKEALMGLDPDTARYKGLSGFLQVLLERLAARNA